MTKRGAVREHVPAADFFLSSDASEAKPLKAASSVPSALPWYEVLAAVITTAILISGAAYLRWHS
jgi:hypothetical protein